MSIEVDTDEDIDAFLEIVAWAQTNNLWNGREVALADVEDFQCEIENKIYNLLLGLDPSSKAFEELSAFFSMLGSTGLTRSLIEKEIEQLRFGRENLIQQTGFGKSCKKIWKKHKTEIIIGVAVAAVIVTVVVVTVSTAGTGTPAAAGAGRAALGALETANELSKKDRPKSPPPEKKPTPPDTEVQGIPEVKKEAPSWESITKLEPYSKRAVSKEIERILPLPEKTWYTDMLPLKKEVEFPNLDKMISIAGINGIMTSEEGAASHKNYLQKMAGDCPVDWTYDKSYGLVGDLATVFARDYLGIPSKASRTLEEKWTDFHKANIDNPNAKILHFCHSRGAIKTNNALIQCPKEVQDRIIVVAIAPAAIIPEQACFRAFNYASKKDIVHTGELVLPGFFDSNETEMSSYMKIIQDKRKELILLDPHPDATGIDHDFQSPTFTELIEKHIQTYKEEYGNVSHKNKK